MKHDNLKRAPRGASEWNALHVHPRTHVLPEGGWMGRRSAMLWLCASALWVAGCKDPYRVGERVLVTWEGRDYPAYIIEAKGRGRFRVHFEGYDSRWDEDVTVDRIKGRVSGPVTSPPAPDKVARAAGITPKASSSAAPVSPYKPGDKVRVRWRGSVYPATIMAVVAPDRFLVHYDGHEAAWDETVVLDRIVTKP